MTTSSITARTRMLIEDIGRPFVANFTADGVSTVFDLPWESISSTGGPSEAFPFAVSIGGSPVAPSQYVIDEKLGVVTFLSPPTPQGANIQATGWAHDYWLDEEVAQAVQDQFALHVQDQSPQIYIDPQPGQTALPQVEEYLVAILAARELLWMLATDTSQQVDIHTPDGVVIPVTERWRQVLQQITSWKDEYESLSLALGVGVFRIQVLNQRRVSLTTNRLVPLYREQEYNAPYCGFNPTAAPVGALVTITGLYFSNATQVAFGGVPCQPGGFTVVDDETITATVPPGALTGQISITTPYGVALSTAQFVVGQPPPFVLSGPQMVEPPIPPGL